MNVFSGSSERQGQARGVAATHKPAQPEPSRCSSSAPCPPGVLDRLKRLVFPLRHCRCWTSVSAGGAGPADAWVWVLGFGLSQVEISGAAFGLNIPRHHFIQRGSGRGSSE